MAGYTGGPLDAGYFFAPYIPLQHTIHVFDEKGHTTHKIEDYIFPRDPGSKGTEVETLPSGENLGGEAVFIGTTEELLQAVKDLTPKVDYDWKRERIEVQKQRVQECPSPISGLTTIKRTENHHSILSAVLTGLGFSPPTKP